MVSIFAPHFFNWTRQLEDSGHDIYWLDLFDSRTRVEKIDFVHQITGWRYRIDYPGRYFVKSKLPGLNSLINSVNERDLQEVLTAKIRNIKPDVVHSFVMYLAAAPILEVMKNFPQIKWVYSSWGSDLYFYRKKEKDLLEMKRTLPKLDYMFTDCKRDHAIALENGFRGEFLGVFPGGGGFDFKKTDPLMSSFGERKLILVKGYQGLHGRCIQVLEALVTLEKALRSYQIVVFGANKEVKEFVGKSELANWKNLDVLGKIPHFEVMKFMGQAFIYIGNSLSDGTPNTLLEAIIMGAFPIQSDPGGATGEWLEDGKNGVLIKDPEAVEGIAEILERVLSNESLCEEGIKYNLHSIKPCLDGELIKKEVMSRYSYIEQNLQSSKAKALKI